MSTEIETRTTTLAMLRDLERAGAITPTALSLPEGTSYPRVEALFAYFGHASHALRFYLGDLICWGEGRYGDKVYQAAEASGLTEGTLQNYASTCGRVAPERRREGLSFAVHAEVASLRPEEQERWLSLAEDKGYTVKQLRELLRDEGLVAPRPQPQWSDKTGADADRLGPAASTPEPTAVEPRAALAEGGPPMTPGGPPELTPTLVTDGNGYALVLALRRDLLNDRIDRGEHPPSPRPIDYYERERDALNWALEHLAPEMA